MTHSSRDRKLHLAPLFIGMTLVTCCVAPVTTWAAPADEEKQPPNAPREPVRIRVEGFISTLSHATLVRQLNEAKAMNADFIIVDINSPGGDAQASMDMANELADIHWAKVVAYVDKLAMSGAAFVAIGCEEIVLWPEAKIGDAGPIVIGEDSMFRHAPEKIVSFLAAELRSVARKRNHPPALAEAMIDKDLEVFYFRNLKTGDVACMSEAEVADLRDGADWEKQKSVFGSGGGRFLTLHGTDAVETKLVAATVTSEKEFYDRYHITEEPYEFANTWVDTLVAILNVPFVTGALLVLGLILIYVELFIPGFGIFGILSGACFALFFWAKFLGGTADWLEVLLFVGGLICLGVEIFILPGFGVFGVTGILLVIAGLTMAIAPATGRLTNSAEAITSSAVTVASALGVFVAVGIVMSRFLGSIPFLKRMMLVPADAATGGSIDATSTPEPPTVSPILGMMGVARTPLRPSGKALIDGREVDVIADGQAISQGSEVKVVLVQGNRVVVRLADRRR